MKFKALAAIAMTGLMMFAAGCGGGGEKKPADNSQSLKGKNW